MPIKQISFMELLSNIVDNRGKTCPTAEAGIPLIATNCVKNSNLYPTFEKVRHVSTETMETWFRGHPIPGDLIFVTKGSPGQVCMVPAPVPFCIAQDMVAIRANEELIYPPYLFAVLRAPQTQRQIENMHVGSLIPHFKKGDFDKLILNIDCDKNNQKLIGDIYLKLSQKIELNRQMNETLEEMARSTFKSWFVDFDPVVAKAAGQAPAHMSAETADLFPASFNEEGLPDSWSLGQLDDVLVLQRGFDLPVKKRIEGNHPVFAAGGFHGTHEEAKVRAPGVVTGRSGVIGNVFLVQDDFWPLNTTLWVKEFKLGSAYYSYQLLKTIDLAAFNAGSAVPSLNRNHIHNYSVCLPDEKVIAAYEEIASIFFQKIKTNNEQNQTLADLRDTLLPKLMSGEIRLRDAEKAVEDA